MGEEVGVELGAEATPPADVSVALLLRDGGVQGAEEDELVGYDGVD